jgi:uncharacterized membrane protein
MRLAYLVKGLPGHPLHPPLTDVTIGAYTFATVAAVLHRIGVADTATAHAWWLALVVALCSTALTAATGFVDWIEIEWGSEPWKTATLHLTAMLTASGVFLAAALVGHGAYAKGNVDTAGLILTLVGFALLTTGGWLGGKVVFVHGMRVLPSRRPEPSPPRAPSPPEPAPVEPGRAR